MALRTNISLNFFTGQADGMVDCGEFQYLLSEKQRQSMAKHALVFQLANIRTRHVQPLCYFFTGDSVPAAVLQAMIRSIIERLLSANINVRAIVCDASTVNQSAVNQLVLEDLVQLSAGSDLSATGASGSQSKDEKAAHRKLLASRRQELV